ncbi:MAG: selenide, water dikinase SelD [Acidimicrobiia bacterium]
MNSIRLTSFSHGAGCACKLSSVELSQIITPLVEHRASRHVDLMVGLDTSDDAGVMRLPGGDGRALVQTVDFFTPIVDDPGDWGRIAATNALSDIYAMGATPLTALQLLGWPRDTLPFEAASEVVMGGADVMAVAGCVIVGGHSIDDAEPTYGFAVTGLVDQEAVVTNAGARPGDVLVLTKPLGAGIATTAHKAGKCPPEVLARVVSTMATLNDRAGAALRPNRAHAATDVTGFGLLGHLTEILEASGVGAVIEVAKVPVIDGIRLLYEQGFYPGGSRRNLAAVSGRVEGDEDAVAILADAQTSGGLLVALPTDTVDSYLADVSGSEVVGHITDHRGRILLS